MSEKKQSGKHKNRGMTRKEMDARNMPAPREMSSYAKKLRGLATGGKPSSESAALPGPPVGHIHDAKLQFIARDLTGRDPARQDQDEPKRPEKRGNKLAPQFGGRHFKPDP